MGEKQNQPFQLSFNASLKIGFQGSRVTSDEEPLGTERTKDTAPAEAVGCIITPGQDGKMEILGKCSGAL